MLKNRIYIVFITTLITLSISVFGQSKFELDTAKAKKYTEQIKKHISDSGDTLAIYLDSLNLLKQNSNSNLVKGICQISKGYVYFKNSEFDSAIICFEIGKHLISKQMDTVFYLKSLDLCAVCYNYNREPDSAIISLNEAISILLKGSNDELLAKSYFDLSNSYSAKSDYKKAIKYLSLAVSIYKENDIVKYNAYLYNSMAIMYYKSGNIEKSKSMFYNSISIAKNLTDYNLLASLYLNLGDLYARSDKNYDSATYFLQECINISTQNSLYYIIPMAEVNLSSVYYGQEKYQECINILQDNLNSNNYSVRSSAWINTGIAYHLLNSDSAKFYLSIGVKYANDYGDLENLLAAYKTLYSIDSTDQNFKSALNYYILYERIKDTINTRELMLELSRNEERQEVLNQKKEKEFWENEAKMSQELAKSKTIRNTLLLILLLFSILIIIFVNSLRRKIKSHHQDLKLLHERLVVKKKLLESNNAELINLINTKNTLFSIISHDLRSPIATSMQLIELIEENYESFSKEEIITMLHELKLSTKNVFELLNNLLEWSRVEQGRLEPKFEIFKLKEAMISYLSQVVDLAKNKEIELELSVDENVIVKSDHNFLSTIFRNLISNAIKFSPRGGKIFIEGKYEDDNYLLCIIDHGEGMKSEFVNKIFNIESKETNLGTENEKGSGFGLKLVKSMVEKLGAEITVESKIGEGSTFCIKMPLSK